MASESRGASEILEKVDTVQKSKVMPTNVE